MYSSEYRVEAEDSIFILQCLYTSRTSRHSPTKPQVIHRVACLQENINEQEGASEDQQCASCSYKSMVSTRLQLLSYSPYLQKPSLCQFKEVQY